MNTVYLDPKLVPQFLLLGYKGKKLEAVLTERFTVNTEDLQWSGGTRYSYTMVNLETGKACGGVGPGIHYTSTNYVVVCSMMFCGRDHGLRFYMHPSNASLLLTPPTVTLSENERIVLVAIRSFKPAYRRESVLRDYSMNAAVYDATVEKLKIAGYLAANGGLTVKGRNAAK